MISQKRGTGKITVPFYVKYKIIINKYRYEMKYKYKLSYPETGHHSSV